MTQIEKIRQEIERLKKEASPLTGACASQIAAAAYNKMEAYDNILSFLDTLQEQDFPTSDEEIEAFLASHPKVEVPEKYKTPDWLYKESEQEPEAIPTFDSIWGWYSYIIEQSKKDPGYSERNSKLLADSFLELASRQEPLNLPPFILDKIDDALKNLQESIQRKIQEPSLPSDVDEAAEMHFETMEVLEHENIFDETHNKIYKAGAEWMKNKMLEEAFVQNDAVHDGRIELEGDPLPCLDPIILLPWPQFKPDDKVRIVVLKEEEE